LTPSLPPLVRVSPNVAHSLSRKIRRARLKDRKAPFRIVIVRDMWLTGFDAPCLHTIYADKPMQGHGLAPRVRVAAKFPISE
jgi:type I restriction enzyme R subunit